MGFSLLCLVVESLVLLSAVSGFTPSFLPIPTSSTNRVRVFASSHLQMAAADDNEDKDNIDLDKNTLPAMIVFDLDNTLWTPELYQLQRKLQHRANNKKTPLAGTPLAGTDIHLFPGAQYAIEAIRNGEFPNTKFAVASRTQQVDWANDLLDQFHVRDIFDYVEIFPAHKKAHFKNIAHASGISYSDMLFFDDARDGKYGNCESVAELGVLSVHCPNGMETKEVFTKALERFQEWDKSPNSIVEFDGSVTNKFKNGTTSSESEQFSTSAGTRLEGVVKVVNLEKRYGFIRCRAMKTQDLFFHFTSLQDRKLVAQGDKLSFEVQRDATNGKNMAVKVEVLSSSSSETTTTTTTTTPQEENENTISMRTFSMNLPFAALLANEYKTLESRNGTMFVPYPPGTQMLLQVGQRIYPDGNKHIEVMTSGGLDMAEIERLKSLPTQFGKGMAVAILEIGRTYETTVEERCDPDFQRKVAAYGADSGRMITEIKRIQYLKRPVKVSGQGGIFLAKIDRDVIPDGWLELVPPSDAAAPVGTLKSGVPLYSIEG
jgi:magnesium-dependent phosphatase 1